ncbi:hypothetical protein [Streptomyces sp. NPDC059909]|uniref:hypothetical protein n=1 Tax=Streptomyces sp. NPDC059909 TaxID=3346998 RepID=UPI00365F316E
MDRSEVAPWLKAAYPELEPEQEQECAEDLCLRHSFGTSVMADGVQLSFRYEAGGTALVTLHAMQS